MTACVGDGDEFVLNCTVHSPSHAWTVPPFDETSVSRARQQIEFQRSTTLWLITHDSIISSSTVFANELTTLRLVEDTHDSIISSLTVVANEQLSGTVVSCSDGLVTEGQGEVQETTIIVLTAGIII